MAEGELLGMLCNEEEQAEISKWSEDNDCKISHMFEHRLDKADELRQKGNDFLKEGNFEEAQRRYLAAIFQVDFSMMQYGDGAKEYEDKINTRKIKILSNVCVARLKHKDYSGVKTVSEVGLRVCGVAKLDEETTKASEAKFWYLKGQANTERGFSEEACEDLKKAAKLQPGDQSVRKALQQAANTRKEDKETAKEAWRNKLMTEDQVLEKGTWWHPATLVARFREQHRLGKGPLSCCARRRPAEGEEEDDDAIPSQSQPTRGVSSAAREYPRARTNTSATRHMDRWD